MRCSFEETVEILVDAGIFNEVDNLRGKSWIYHIFTYDIFIYNTFSHAQKGPTEGIMTGGTIPTGTGSVEVHLDESYFDNVYHDDDDETENYNASDVRNIFAKYSGMDEDDNDDVEMVIEQPSRLENAKNLATNFLNMLSKMHQVY